MPHCRARSRPSSDRPRRVAGGAGVRWKDEIAADLIAEELRKAIRALVRRRRWAQRQAKQFGYGWRDGRVVGLDDAIDIARARLRRATKGKR